MSRKNPASSFTDASLGLITSIQSAGHLTDKDLVKFRGTCHDLSNRGQRTLLHYSILPFLRKKRHTTFMTAVQLESLRDIFISDTASQDQQATDTRQKIVNAMRSDKRTGSLHFWSDPYNLKNHYFGSHEGNPDPSSLLLKLDPKSQDEVCHQVAFETYLEYVRRVE